MSQIVAINIFKKVALIYIPKIKEVIDVSQRHQNFEASSKHERIISWHREQEKEGIYIQTQRWEVKWDIQD